MKYPGEKWQLPGLSEPGLYPIRPRRGTWYLDKGRKHPVLRVTRQQLPLAPAFALTAHAAQGQTLAAAIIDMQIGRGTNPIASYVALTRIKTRHDLLIYRVFEHGLFTQGPLEGPELLLRVLRGEEVDWEEIEKRHTPQRRCVGCNAQCFKDEFLLSQWNRKDEKHRCTACVEKKREEGTPFECMNCFLWKSASAFDEKNLQRYVHRVCVDCIEKRACIECGVAKVQEEFTPREWIETTKHTRGRQQGRCKACMTRNKPQQALRQCIGQCGQLKPQSEFTPAEWAEAAKHRSGRERGRCKACMARNQLQKVCSMCGKSKEESEYKSKKEYMKSGEDRACKECSTRNKPQQALRQCIGQCGQLKPQSEFTPAEWAEAGKDRSGRQRGRCKACMARHRLQKVCSICGQAKEESEYKSKKEYMKSDEDRACKECSGKRRGFWTCIKCKHVKTRDAFSKWLENRKSKQNNGKARCNACTTEEEEEERRVRQGSHAAVQHTRMS